MRRYLPTTSILICAAILAPAAAQAQRGGGGHSGGGGHGSSMGGSSMRGSSMGGSSMRSFGPAGGGQARYAAPRSSYSWMTAPRAPYSMGRYPTAPRASMVPRPGYVNAPSRNSFATRPTSPTSRAPTRPTYWNAAAGRGTANSAANRGGGRGPINFRDRGFRDRRFRDPRFRGYYDSFVPFYGWGWPYYDDFGDYYDCYYDPDCYADNSQYAAPAPYPDQTYQPGDQDLYAPPPNGAGGAAQYAPPYQPTPSTDDYVLIRKDGGVLFASGFTVQNGEMTYVNSDGIRRKVMLAQLDLDATRKMNDERGITIPLPK